jgi:hypothetical protein
MGSRNVRIAENQALFRAMNDRMAVWDERREAPADEAHLFFCECGEPTCLERVHLTLAEYAAIRESPVRFAVLAGHVFPEAEKIVAERDGYLVVEKYDDVRAIVERMHTRWGPDS